MRFSGPHNCSPLPSLFVEHGGRSQCHLLKTSAATLNEGLYLLLGHLLLGRASTAEIAEKQASLKLRFICCAMLGLHSFEVPRVSDPPFGPLDPATSS